MPGKEEKKKAREQEKAQRAKEKEQRAKEKEERKNARAEKKKKEEEQKQAKKESKKNKTGGQGGEEKLTPEQAAYKAQIQQGLQRDEDAKKQEQINRTARQQAYREQIEAGLKRDEDARKKREEDLAKRQEEYRLQIEAGLQRDADIRRQYEEDLARRQEEYKQQIEAGLQRDAEARRKSEEERAERQEAYKKQIEEGLERAKREREEADRAYLKKMNEEFERDSQEVTERANSIEEESGNLLRARISHRKEDADKLKEQQGKYEELNAKVSGMGDTYSVLEKDKQYNFQDRLKALQDKNENAKKFFVDAKDKVEKYKGYRDEFEAETQNKRLMRLVRKISLLGAQGAAANQTPGAVLKSGNIQAVAPKYSEDDKTKKEEVDEFYSEHAEVWKGAANSITDFVHNHLDLSGKKKDGSAADTSDKVFGVFWGFIDSLIAAFQAWNTFSRMYKRDKNRDLMEGEGQKDHADRWQDARVGMEKIVGVITSVLGTIGTVAGTGPGAILGIISNCAVLFMKCITIADSGSRAHGINKRKWRLWKTIEEKRKKYLDEAAGGDQDAQEAADALDVNQWYRTRAGGINKKRAELREKLANNDDMKLSSGTHIATSRQQHVGKGWLGKDVTVYEGYDNLYNKIDQEKQKRYESLDSGQIKRGKTEDKKQKKKIRLMEALQLIEQYYEEDQAQNKHFKMIAHALEESATESLDMVANLANLSVIGDNIGKIIKVATAAYGLVRDVGAWVVNHIRDAAGHGEIKGINRKEMASNMYSSIEGMLSMDYGWDGNDFLSENIDKVVNYRVESGARRLKHMRGMMTGLDVHLEPLMTAGNKSALVDSLASSFSQDGNG